MNALERLIREEIGAQGPMRFDRFMELALYHPEHGYYATPRPLGRTGDFFTSVSVGPLFGRLLVRQFRQMAELLNEDEFWIVEQGAHNGQLARDILEEYRSLPAFPGKLRYLIVERSRAAREAQAQLLSEFGEQVRWVERIEDFAGGKPAGVYFSNELVDAFPVRVIERDAEWKEMRVTCERGGSLGWCSTAILDDELRDAVKELALPELPGYRTEINLEARRWMRETAGFLRRGYILTIDYGHPASLYYAPFRREGTLTCFREHRQGRDVLAEPGRNDITAQVDFTALAHVGEKAGWATLGFVDQQRLLTGIVECESDAVRPADVRAFQTLTHPEHLGSRFKALVQGKDAPASVAGLRFARTGQLD
jgi:SAM-dependent MidA family methyltransferase